MVIGAGLWGSVERFIMSPSRSKASMFWNSCLSPCSLLVLLRRVPGAAVGLDPAFLRPSAGHASGLHHPGNHVGSAQGWAIHERRLGKIHARGVERQDVENIA